MTKTGVVLALLMLAPSLSASAGDLPFSGAAARLAQATHGIHALRGAIQEHRTAAQGQVLRDTFQSSAVRVVDGDTISVGEVRIRLHGIDAPERSQTCTQQGRGEVPCGQFARAHLEGLIRASPSLSCTSIDRDRYGRPVSRCVRSDGVDINAAMVRQGWALSFTPSGIPPYAQEEGVARAGRAGIHAMRYQAPAEYRRQHRH